jgi:hypothetical protein
VDVGVQPKPEPGYVGGCSDLEFLRCEQTTTVKVEYR